MAMSGYALVDHTPNGYMDYAKDLFYDNPNDLVYDWLESKGISWRLYYSGSFFFMQMPRMLVKYQKDFSLQNTFRPIHRLIDDFRNGDVAQVTFVEPLYYDDYRRNNQQATDDHSPAPLMGGQRFLKMVWEAVKSPGVWENLLLLLSYDEHGSIFDHVMPPAIPTDPPPRAIYASAFKTLGLRVPGIVISPFVEPGSICSELFDHTSLLKLLGDKFDGGRYSPLVDSRPVHSLSEALNEALLASSSPVRSAPDDP